MNKLIPMVDFVLSESKKAHEGEITFNHVGLNCEKYAKFLKQTLGLWMFVPCDEEGNVMKEPYMVFADDNEECDDYIKLFCEAKERCLFEVYSFEDDIENYWYFGLDEFKLIAVDKSKSIELLVECNLELTPIALKQIGYEQ